MNVSSGSSSRVLLTGGSQERGEDMRVLWGLEGLGLDGVPGVPVIPMTFPLPPQPGFGTSSTRCGAARRRLS